MYNKIQEYKQMGYSIRKTAREADIDRKTVKKYWDMKADEYTQYMSECCERKMNIVKRYSSEILDPYKKEIAELLET